jgi:hypothetical protein
MTNEKLTVNAVAFTSETVNLQEVETMEESFAASSGSCTSGNQN